MTAAQPVPSASEAVPQPAADPAIARAEARLRVLARLAAKGMEVAEAVEANGSPDSAETFAKVSRAVRLTVTLEAKLDEVMRTRLAGEVARADKPRPGGRARAGTHVGPETDDDNPYAFLEIGKTARARELMVDVVDRETPDPVEYDHLLDAIDERLIYDEAYRALEDLPLRDIVERLCVDLDLKPDWSRWIGEGWATNPPFFRPLCSRFKRRSRAPILDVAPDPTSLE